MKPERRSRSLLGVTRSKAKMYEYRVAPEHHIEIPRDPGRLFSLSVGMLGDLAVLINTRSDDTGEAADLRQLVRFSAQFFDAYCHGTFEESLNNYLLLMGAASYYLSDLPGSAAVLAERLPAELLDLEAGGLEHLSAWILKGTFGQSPNTSTSPFRKEIDSIVQWASGFFQRGEDLESFDTLARSLRLAVYRLGSPRQLLFADVALAVTRKRRDHSARQSLPTYSDHSVEQWSDALSKDTFIRELWPAQRMLGEEGVLRGISGVVQMPTSAGKTRATELIIRSAFLAERATLAVIVAPFRALCHEIRNSLVEAFAGEPVQVDELTDVFQPDFDILDLLTGRQVIVVTPEKLVYVLRHSPELTSGIGVLIYDEGHQFDNGSRGVTYELLVTSLKALVPRGIQTVLISAVISNADRIGAWLNGDDGVVVKGAGLSPTFRSLAFASWQDRLGRLQFVRDDDPDSDEFFVPRVIESLELEKKGRERVVRYFPTKNDSPAIALYLGLKLCPSGSVAVFCGTKATVTGLCEQVVDVFERSAPLDRPLDFSNPEEVERLASLHAVNMGDNAAITESARLGVFAHHGNVPHGLRIAVEHAMRIGAARMVVCTSTLAQGVNLPIRYLIVSSTQQGTERIKVRDFHNLIGRAGRSGMHTEGSILFANPELYDRRRSRSDRWRWDAIKDLLQPDNTEPCISTLLSVFRPLESDDGRYQIPMEPLELLKACIGRRSDLDSFADQIVQRHADKQFTESGLRFQIDEKRRIVTALESYLMAYWEESTSQEPIDALARQTLAYHLAEGNATEQGQLIDLFRTIANNIERRVPESSRRKVFGRTLYGVRDSLAIQKWVENHIEELVEAEDTEAMLDVIWPLLTRNVQNNTFRRCSSQAALKRLAHRWIDGATFGEIFADLYNSGVRFGHGRRPRIPTIDNVVDICEGALAFEGMLVIGAIAEIFEFLNPALNDASELLRELQKQIKYGLRSLSEIVVYETGFSDRVVATEIAQLIGAVSSRRELRRGLRSRRNDIQSVVAKYPLYYQARLARLLA